MRKEGPKQTPQVFPLANLIKPFSPQVGPQEFFIVHELSLDPTMKTA
jgi:hypothetical protein